MPSFFNTSLYASPLLRTAGFREALLDAMAIKSEMGTVRRGRRSIQYSEDGPGAVQATEADLEIEQGVDRSFRVCDFIAWQVSAIEGAPRCELFWTKEMRDGAVEACVAFLKTYGDRFTAEAPPARFIPREEGTPGIPDPRSPRDEGGCPRGPGDLLARRGGRGPPGRTAGVTHQGEVDPAEEAPRRRAGTVGSGRPRRYAKAAGGTATSGSSAATSSHGSRAGSIELAGIRRPAPGDR